MSEHDMDSAQTREEHLENRISEALDGLDGASIFDMVVMTADALDVDLTELLTRAINNPQTTNNPFALPVGEALILGMIFDSQSNPTRALTQLLEASKINDEMMRE